MIKEVISLSEYNIHFPISMDFACSRDVHLMQALNASKDLRPHTKNRVKDPTIERQWILGDEDYI